MNNDVINIDVKFTFTLSRQDIDDIMITALEGGINYWCRRVEPVGKPLGEYASDQISRSGTLRLYDIEDPNENWDLNLDKLIKGIRLFIENTNTTYIDAAYIDGKNIDVSMIDADDADAIIQYALFGEIVFG